MVGKKRKVIIDDLALNQLNQAYNYIRKVSPQNATKVRNDIFSSANSLSTNPENIRLTNLKMITMEHTGLSRNIITG